MPRLVHISATLALATGLLYAGDKQALLNSKHDFRASSTATLRSVNREDACIFCHTPHNSGPVVPLWNRNASVTEFSRYQSSTLDAAMEPMTAEDASKLCLSCHDGTIALGDTLNDGLIEFLQGATYTLPESSSANVAAYRGFTDDHPFAFVPVPGSEIQIPPPGGAVRLDGGGRVQCTSCHDPHTEQRDPVVGKFLVKSNQASALCQTCHQKGGWINSSHRLPSDPLHDQRYSSLQGAHTGYTSVSENGCESCHRPHAPQIERRLVKFQEETTCYACHDASVADTGRNIQAEFQNKLYKHPVNVTPSIHDPSERPSAALFPLPETSSGAPRHAECADCHNPHFANNATAQPPQVSGVLAGTTGHSSAGTFQPSSVNEYELCFKCHADSANKPQFFDQSVVGIGYGRNPQRQFDVGNPNRFNTRMEYEFSPSYHPVTRSRSLTVGPGGEIPSLRPAPINAGGMPILNRILAATSLIYCTDCHNSDTGRNLGTPTGPTGPHGSNLPHLLERENTLEAPPVTPGDQSAGASYSPANHALCDKCHDVEGSILLDQSFSDHRKHVRGTDAGCSTCHDPHASMAPMLINFDLSVVGPSRTGLLEYRRTGPKQGYCYLRCHGKDHDPASYGPTGH